MQPHRTGAQPVEDEAAELVGLHADAVLTRALDGDGRGRRWEQLAGHAARFLGVPPKAVDVRLAEALPLTAAGKKNYQALETLGGNA